MTEATTEGLSAGTLLRQAREAAGLHVANLAANLKVPVRKLEALEEDRYDLLPDAVFVRALAASVCRTLKLDPKPVLERLPQTPQPRLVKDTEAINAPFRSPRDGPGPGWFDQVSRPVVLTVVALLLGALVLIFLPVAQRGYESVTQANQPDPVMPPPGAAATVPSVPAPVETMVTTEPAALPAPLPASAAGPVPTAAAITPAPDPSVAPSGPTATPAQAAPAAAPGDGIVVFRTKGPSWVHVTDASGTTVLRRLMGPGESAAVSGALPLSVTVGDAVHTEVQVRGKSYNLAPVARDNVARFEVK